LKAFLVFHSFVPPKTHDCNQLLSLCEAFGSSLAVFHDDCILVTRYGVVPRYPDFIPDPTEQEAQAVIAAMERIRIAVLALLPA